MAIATRQCGFVWRAVELLGEVDASASIERRRSALGQAGDWLGTLPRRLALEQEDAVTAVAERCGYSVEAVQRRFRARYWKTVSAERESPDPKRTTRALEAGPAR